MPPEPSRLAEIERQLSEALLLLRGIDRQLTRHDPEEAARAADALSARVTAMESEAHFERGRRARWDAVVAGVAALAAAVSSYLRGGP